MAKGRTQFRFHGGPHDGVVLDDQPARLAGKTISQVFSTYSEWDPDLERVSVCRSKSGWISPQWFAQGKAEYRKRLPSSVDGGSGVDYDFVRCVTIGRCMAVTRDGHQCRNTAAEGSTLCETAHRPAAGGITMITDEFLIGELSDIATSGAPEVVEILKTAEEQRP